MAINYTLSNKKKGYVKKQTQPGEAEFVLKR